MISMLAHACIAGPESNPSSVEARKECLNVGGRSPFEGREGISDWRKWMCELLRPQYSVYRVRCQEKNKTRIILFFGDCGRMKAGVIVVQEREVRISALAISMRMRILRYQYPFIGRKKWKPGNIPQYCHHHFSVDSPYSCRQCYCWR